MRAASDQASLQFLHSLARAIVPCDLGIYRICESSKRSGESAHLAQSRTEPSLIALQRWDVDEGSGSPNCLYQFMWFRYLWHMRAANDQASLHILHSLARAIADCTTKMGCRWRLRPNCLYQFMWFRYLSHMRAANDQASLHILHSLARAFADCTTKMGCRWRLRPNCLYQFMWFRYLSHMRAANDQASLHILHSLGQIVYISSCD